MIKKCLGIFFIGAALFLSGCGTKGALELPPNNSQSGKSAELNLPDGTKPQHSARA